MPLLSVPFQLALGTKRTEVFASAASSSEAAALGEPKLFQLLPPLVEYCHVPFVLTTAVTAMPDKAPASASVTFVEISADTSVPGLLAGSSLIAVRLFAPDSTGALFTAPVQA